VIKAANFFIGKPPFPHPLPLPTGRQAQRERDGVRGICFCIKDNTKMIWFPKDLMPSKKSRLLSRGIEEDY
jgi:hypothetical protein